MHTDEGRGGGVGVATGVRAPDPPSDPAGVDVDGGRSDASEDVPARGGEAFFPLLALRLPILRTGVATKKQQIRRSSAISKVQIKIAGLSSVLPHRDSYSEQSYDDHHHRCLQK